MQLYLIMVLVGFAAFTGCLGFVWLSQYLSELGAPASKPGQKGDANQLRKAA
jgi:hypothetical protein